jgi:predicted nucleotidyltransferase component of viral defense system
MPAAEGYRAQAALLVKIMPLIAKEPCFALKGGTAINLFVRDMPRLSVDIDLTYLPVHDREGSLREIDAPLRRIARDIEHKIRGARTALVPLAGENKMTRLNVSAERAQVKVEVTPVLRGSVYPPALMAVSARAEEEFGFAEMQVVSFPDLYAGKIVAALDRQHPRDLFDVRDLLANEGVSMELRRAFIVYLLSHNRPMAEVIAPARLDISKEFSRGFEGMTEAPVRLDDLISAREALIETIVGAMPAPHRSFLVSFKEGAPEWPLLELDGAKDLPAVRWRLENLAKLPNEKRKALIARLREVLG